MTANTEALLRLFIGCLVFRLGGEQTFTSAEIDDIRSIVGGVQIFLLEDESILLRTKSPGGTERARADGTIL